MSSLRPNSQAASLAAPHFAPVPALRRHPRACVEGMALVHAAVSEAGAVRAHNEDRWQAVPQVGLFVVADGMGGYHAGEIAAELAVQTACQLIPQLLPGLPLQPLAQPHHARAAPAGPEPLDQVLQRSTENDGFGCHAQAPGGADVDALLRRAHDVCNRQILEYAADNPDCLGMGATIASCLIRDGRLHVAHVGDSRVYLLRGGRLMRLTRDHSIGQEIADAGVLKPAQVRRLPGRGILTRALGVEAAVQSDCSSHDWQASDLLLLCTDGLTDLVEDDRIRQLLIDASAAGSGAQARALVAAALQAGGSDDVTVLMVSAGGELAIRTSADSAGTRARQEALRYQGMN